MYTPLVPATPKRAAPNARPKTPKFDPQVHGVDIETDLHGENGVDTFLQLIKRSPKKQAIENKSLEAQLQLGPGGEEQVIMLQLPTQTEAQSEGRSQTEETVVEPRVVCRPSNILWLLANILHQALGNTVSEVPTEQLKSLAINTHTPDTAAPPLAINKTRVTAAAATATNVTTAVASKDQQPEFLKPTTSLPPRQRVPSKKPPTTPPRTERKESTSMKTPAKNNMPTTPPRTSIAKYSSPRHTMVKATGKTQCERGMNPAPTTPSQSPRTKSIPLTQCAGEMISPKTPPKASSKPTAVLSRQKSPKQVVPSSSLPSVQNKLSPHHGLATTSPTASPQKEGVKQPRKHMVENPKGKPMTTKPSNSPPYALPRGKEPVITKAPVKETLTIRTKRAASGPLPPTKRPRPIPPAPGESTRNLQGSNTSSTIATAARPRIASLNTKPLSPIKSSKPPTKPTMFKLLGQEVAKKQAEEKEARKKRMEEAEAAKALQKRKEAKLRKQAPVRNASLSSKALRGSSVCATALGQLEGGNTAASGAGGKAKVSSKQSKTKSTNGPMDASQPALLIQKREPTTKLTSTTSKPAMSRNASGPASSTTNGHTILTPKQGDSSQIENTRKEAAGKGRVAVLEWAAQQKNRRDQTNPQGQVT